MSSEKSKREIGIVLKSDPLFPPLLKEIPDPPERIYFVGRLPDSSIPAVAIVGTRKATGAGRELARGIAKSLSEAGIAVVSGLAMGIDAAGHEGALLGGTATLAVLGNGLDEVYPRQNENLARRIIESGGAIISEYPAGTPALPHQFLARNRIVSGLSLAVVVIEAPAESGALVTARLAAEQGREVFVFPGPTNHPNYIGSHKLIRDGARLVASAADILEDLNLEIPRVESAGEGEKLKGRLIKDSDQLMIFNVLEKAGEPLRIDKIIDLTKLEPQAVIRSVALLTINNVVKETERGYII